MESKEAIEIGKDILKVIESVSRGEKYEAIEKGIKQYCLILENQNVLKEIIRLEQKYFPKPVKKTITIEIEADNENVIKWAEHQIKDLENNVWNHV